MHIPIPEIDPVAISIDRLESGGDIRFSGVDLDSGARVSVLIERKAVDHQATGADVSGSGLVLVLRMERLGARQ